MQLYLKNGPNGAVAKFIRQRTGPSGKAYRISVGPDQGGGFKQWGAPEHVIEENKNDVAKFWEKVQMGAVEWMFGVSP